MDGRKPINVANVLQESPKSSEVGKLVSALEGERTATATNSFAYHRRICCAGVT